MFTTSREIKEELGALRLEVAGLKEMIRNSNNVLMSLKVPTQPDLFLNETKSVRKQKKDKKWPPRNRKIDPEFLTAARDVVKNYKPIEKQVIKFRYRVGDMPSFKPTCYAVGVNLGVSESDVSAVCCEFDRQIKRKYGINGKEYLWFNYKNVKKPRRTETE